MKQKPMLTSFILLIFSWVTGCLGILAAGLYIFSHPLGAWVIIKGLLILIICLLLAAIIRMLGNIGQFLFELKGLIYTLSDIKDIAARQRGLTESIDSRLQAVNDITLSGIREIAARQRNLTESIDARLKTVNEVSLAEIKEIAARQRNLTESIDARLKTTNDVLLKETKEICLGQQHLSESIDSRFNVLNTSTEKLNADLVALSGIVDSIKCFFDRIDKHLELTK